MGLQGSHQLPQPADLGRCWPGLVEISDQADADAVRIDSRAANRSPGRTLLFPALPHLDLAIAQARAVADHEVVVQLAIARYRRARRAAVMHVDVLPSCARRRG